MLLQPYRLAWCNFTSRQHVASCRATNDDKRRALDLQNKIYIYFTNKPDIKLYLTLWCLDLACLLLACSCVDSVAWLAGRVLPSNILLNALLVPLKIFWLALCFTEPMCNSIRSAVTCLLLIHFPGKTGIKYRTITWFDIKCNNSKRRVNIENMQQRQLITKLQDID